MPLYFLRHGESEANEQNLFAGRLDSPLTGLGHQQAKAAHNRVARIGLDFDEIHTSPLTRARDTGAVFALSKGGRKPREVVTEDLIERDFGVLSENNKTLIKKHFGYEKYDEMFHSADGAPPHGESFHSLYGRIAAYHREVLQPLSDAGKTILVVAHKYPIEMFALLAADLSPEDYQDFKIPNSKPSSFEDLGRHALAVPAKVNWLGEMIEIHLATLLVAAVYVGVALKSLLLVAHP
jgi:broad specificity phosphatase PhoE